MLPLDDILCHALFHIRCDTSCGKASYTLSCTLCDTPGEMRCYMLTINIQIDYRVVHRLVFISALLVMAPMMMMPMVGVGVQTR